MAYRNAAIDVRLIAAELGVRYLIEGSVVRPAGLYVATCGSSMGTPGCMSGPTKSKALQMTSWRCAIGSCTKHLDD